ncbi:MAG: lipopolysaccharide biosynthesis protein RfbH [Bdellovibrionaceae bacterium]|nr:lipopolysaccharide biosynthesis protein RfbH [Pseudobdellovibrionaceae bacterium]
MLPHDEKAARDHIKALVANYYEKFHAPKQNEEFIAGTSRVNYGGRVYDEKEMVNLADSMLDFWLTSGRFCDAFEKRFSDLLGVKFSLLVNSGSSANLVAFSALTSPALKERQVKKGDEVITVAAGFPTTVNPIIQYGAVPVFVDICVEDGTYNIDVSQLEAARSEKTKALMIAHTLGNPFNLEAVTAFCKKYNLWLVEDNCDALGSRYNGKYTGTIGDIATSSFYPPHHLTMGEGGAVYTSNTTLKRVAESFRDWGRDCWCPSGKDNTCKKRFDWTLGELPKGYDHKYVYGHFGYNLKVTEMQASVGLAQLDKLESFSNARRENFKFLRESLSTLSKVFVLPNATPNSDPSWFGFLLTVRDGAGFSRDEFTRHLEENRIQTRMLFAGNMIRQPMFNEIRGTGAYRVIGDLKNTDRVTTNTLWIGVYPGMKKPALEYTTKIIHEFVRSRSK